MSKFKVGDLVERVENSYGDMKVGDSGIVLSMSPSSVNIKGFGGGHSHSSLRLVFPNPPHKHAEVIKAWADGADIECNPGSGWYFVEGEYPDWNTRFSYRIKLVVDNTKEISAIRVEMEKLAERLKDLEK